jgi:hypothetical protein
VICSAAGFDRRGPHDSGNARQDSFARWRLAEMGTGARVRVLLIRNARIIQVTVVVIIEYGRTMKTISKWTDRIIVATGKDSRDEVSTVLASEIEANKKTARHSTYEDEVFSFLQRNREVLGIENVIRFANLLVDGAIVLKNRKRLAIEIKLRMNWEKACQAEWEFRNFLKRTDEAKKNPVGGAIVFFEEFSGDWNKKSQKATNLWGWEGWYLYYWGAIDDRPMDLLNLKNGVLDGYPGSA